MTFSRFGAYSKDTCYYDIQTVCVTILEDRMTAFIFISYSFIK